MRTDKAASHICYELDHDVQEYAKRLLAKKFCTRYGRTILLHCLTKWQKNSPKRQYF